MNEWIKQPQKIFTDRWRAWPRQQCISFRCTPPTWLVWGQLLKPRLTSPARPGICLSPVSKHHLLTDSLKNVDTQTQKEVHGVLLSPSMCPAGPTYDLSLTEVRGDSLVVEWQKPVYTGSGPVTGYHVEYSKTGSSEWITANETAVSHRFYKVKRSFKSLLLLIYWYYSLLSYSVL